MVQVKSREGFISCAVKTENPFPRSFFAPNQTEMLATQATFIVIVFVGLLS